ncbi:uncharacterized protein PHACADRAFT_140921 [Phanerochaete carnosa HHB-10118-sp]|uniref:Enoyl reductase (ER) domain-containing protein n=1 Tax=Phanerochaete carnosa (strain HHB-10118-sp) TaxID=650164 RepID=K5WBF1_PHACS|nr:uncharacterized protein PHACADRAFT_140921 [Phanerochaete carnosa HHB-10118-sp]EKM56284.1 hypothetical protein PHACADRAFT_140921 [Phanerochaete carnosa HHB-10118-sp]
MSTHRAVAITAIGSLQVIDLPTPAPEPDEVLVHVRYAALIPFDEYQLDAGFALSVNDFPRVVGFASAGYVKAVGSNVKDLKEGDRVTAYNFPETKNKAAQEYTLVPRVHVAKVPESVQLHEAASITDNYTTAIYTVFGSPNLALPVPPSLVPSSAIPERTAVDLSAPALVYGAGSSSGQFLVQALRIAGFTNIFAVASSHHHTFLRTLGATQTFDYRAPDVVSQIRAAAGSTAYGRFAVAVDPIAARSSLTLLSEILAPSGTAADTPATRLAILAPFKDGDSVTNAPDSAMHFTFPPWLDALFAGKDVQLLPIFTFQLHGDAFSRENIIPVILPRLLERGEIRPNPIRLLNEGSVLDRVNTGLELLRKNKVSGEKVVVDLQFDV